MPEPRSNQALSPSLRRSTDSIPAFVSRFPNRSTEVLHDGEPPYQDGSVNGSPGFSVLPARNRPPISLSTGGVSEHIPFFRDFLITRRLFRSVFKDEFQLPQSFFLIVFDPHQIIPVVFLDRFQERTLGVHRIARQQFQARIHRKKFFRMPLSNNTAKQPGSLASKPSRTTARMLRKE